MIEVRKKSFSLYDKMGRDIIIFANIVKKMFHNLLGFDVMYEDTNHTVKQKIGKKIK